MNLLRTVYSGLTGYHPSEGVGDTHRDIMPYLAGELSDEQMRRRVRLYAASVFDMPLTDNQVNKILNAIKSTQVNDQIFPRFELAYHTLGI
jgi:hypothetical protein